MHIFSVPKSETAQKSMKATGEREPSATRKSVCQICLTWMATRELILGGAAPPPVLQASAFFSWL